MRSAHVAHGIPVSAEILSTFAPREATVPHTRMNAAIITLNPFIPDKTPSNTRFDFGATDVSLTNKK